MSGTDQQLREMAHSLRRAADALEALADARPVNRMPSPKQPILKNAGVMLDWMMLLDDRMERLGMNNSDLARAVWGTVTDPRGFQVARNRDRIGCYRRGTSYPSRATMPKVCAALSIDPTTVVMPTK